MDRGGVDIHEILFIADTLEERIQNSSITPIGGVGKCEPQHIIAHLEILHFSFYCQLCWVGEHGIYAASCHPPNRENNPSVIEVHAGINNLNTKLKGEFTVIYSMRQSNLMGDTLHHI